VKKEIMGRVRGVQRDLREGENPKCPKTFPSSKNDGGKQGGQIVEVVWGKSLPPRKWLTTKKKKRHRGFQKLTDLLRVTVRNKYQSYGRKKSHTW